jgi:hypothetical protein
MYRLLITHLHPMYRDQKALQDHQDQPVHQDPQELMDKMV